MISMQHIQSYCDAIAAAFKPRKIILFGFYDGRNISRLGKSILTPRIITA